MQLAGEIRLAAERREPWWAWTWDRDVGFPGQGTRTGGRTPRELGGRDACQLHKASWENLTLGHQSDTAEIPA